MRAEISQIEYHLPEKVVTNEMLAAENPSWEIEKVVQRSGVRSRHIAAENETALDLARPRATSSSRPGRRFGKKFRRWCSARRARITSCRPMRACCTSGSI
jgi:hypothetical protein